MLRRSITALILAVALAGCEQLGIPDPERQAAAAEAEGRAIGSACRHSGRALEDCFMMNPGASKSAIFEGWRSMNDYMTENKIESVKPTLPSAAMPMPRPARDDSADPPGDQSGKADGARDAGETPPERPRSRTLRSMQDH